MTLRTSLWRILAIALTASPTSAIAAAWTPDAGHGQVIVTGAASRAGDTFDGARHLHSTPRYEKLDLQALMEYGATDQLALILAPGLRHVETGTSGNSMSGEPNYVEFGARYRFAKGADWVLSGQTTLRWADISGGSGSVSVDDTRTEIDMRGLFGYSFSVARRPAFLDLQVAHRFRSGGSADEVHGDVTLGVWTSLKWLLLLQSFNVVSEGAGRPGFPSYDYFKFQPSAVYQLTPHWAVQAGGFTTYAGRNAIQENGLILGVRFKF